MFVKIFIFFICVLKKLLLPLQRIWSFREYNAVGTIPTTQNINKILTN